MNKDYYEQFKNQISSSKLKENLKVYYDRLSKVYSDKKTLDGITISSKIREIIQSELFKCGCEYVWLVPIETSIDEYSKNNFIAYNPYNKMSYSLVQSPQIQKEAAAVLLGSNFRLVDCYRGEKTDATHANIFQQIDVEFANKAENEIRSIGKRLIEQCFKKIANIDLKVSDCYSYKTLVNLYGTDNPNLCNGFKIEEQNQSFYITIEKEYLNEVKSLISKFSFCTLKDDKLFFDKSFSIEKIRLIRQELINKCHQNKSNIYAYWVTEMPYAEIKNGVVHPTHHIMSMPNIAYTDSDFSFLRLSDEELCNLICNSFDLIICNNNRAVEVLGGDERINIFSLQYEAIKRLNYSVEQYAYLLETLRFNELHEQKRLGGFAIGTERLAQFLINEYDMQYVQLFPTNLPEGQLTHATSIEDMRRRIK